ncbi:MAG: hypothetical protein LC795_03580 [Acidobacteria bacterium]|nr:hypothetical protein [Acidobacteriota bacterium]
MRRESDFADFPERVSAGAARGGAHYVRAEGHYAVHQGEAKQDAADAEMTFAPEGIAVYRGAPREARAGKAHAHEAALTPVYRLHPDGPLAVPTGKIFLRFREGVEAATRRKEIERAGYEVIEIPPYSQSGAWVRSASGDVARSLTDLDALEKLADVENVEPQMLVERSLR